MSEFDVSVWRKRDCEGWCVERGRERGEKAGHSLVYMRVSWVWAERGVGEPVDGAWGWMRLHGKEVWSGRWVCS